MGGKSCPIVNEASNVISGIKKGDNATAIKNAGLLGLYAATGAAGGSSKVVQKSAINSIAVASVASHATNRSAH